MTNHKMSEKRPTIYAIDFDGTIVCNKWPDIGEGVPEVMAFIGQIQQRGDKWILWTMRESERLEQALSWLAVHGLFPNAINDNLPELQKAFKNNPRKVFANVYIDDHNAGGLTLPPLMDE